MNPNHIEMRKPSPGEPRPDRRRGGQAVFMSVLLISALIFGATTIGGFLMVIQIRQTTDVADSAKAIFAADAGINCALYNYRHPGVFPQCFFNGGGSVNTFTFSNGASATFTCFEDNRLRPQDVVQCNSPNTLYILSKGSAGTSHRAFLYSVIEAPP